MDKRTDFPILKKKINGHTMVYFDNAATAQKPAAVIKAVSDYYKKYNSNVHRGLNPLAEEATRRYEAARDDAARFIGAKRSEIVFTRGTTESINLIARSWGEQNLRAGDIVILSLSEHHSNIVPWLQLKEKIGIKLSYIPLHNDGTWNMAAAKKLLTQPRVRLLAVSQVSNVLGLINPVSQLITAARRRGIVTAIDAAQSSAHIKIEVAKLNCDFLSFSGHKIGGPTGIGVLYIRTGIMPDVPPFLGGGDMVSEVKLSGFQTKEAPYCYEAGTSNIAGVIGLGAACRYLEALSWPDIVARERELTDYFLKKIRPLKFVRLLGTGQNKLPIFSMTITGIHPHDAADLLGQTGIILRAGQHCAQPLHDNFKIAASLRASLRFYNTEKEIDYFIVQLKSLFDAFNR